MNFIVKDLEENGHECLVYADNLVIFSNCLYLNFAIDSLNSAHGSLHNLLSMSFYSVALKNVKPWFLPGDIINNCPEIVTNRIALPVVSRIIYLRLTLDSKFRWTLRLHNLTKFTSR